MVLKSLFLQGFKSFPDKTEIHFAEGLTAIVGPNGSGKSNLSDAIRWVLGEQSSRSLRGAKMEDVIFGGTTKRGPLGFAEVSLVLDNGERLFRSDFSEIMVTRRYYRSGESEYFLNKRHCRLRDVHEMFMDTGLGRDGYSVIGQGRIDEILSLKSEDRREVFEEAAGITKFRYRREEAERRLTAAEENLTRIRDVFAELEGRRGPLEQQAKKAKQYLLLRDELRVCEISLWLLSLDRLRADMDKTRTDRDACAAQTTAAEGERDRLYAAADTLAEQLRGADVAAEEHRGALRECETRLAGYDRRRAVLCAKIESSEENIRRTEQEHGHTRERASALEEQLAARRIRCAGLDRAYAAQQKETAGCEQREETRRAQYADAQAEQVRVQQAQKALEQERFQLELARAAAQSGLDTMDTRRETIVQDAEAGKSRLLQEETAQQALEDAVRQADEQLKSCTNQLAGAQRKAAVRRERADKLETQLRQLEAQRTDCSNRVRMLSEMQREYEGYSRSVKMVMGAAARGQLSGIHGPVSALLRVPDEYITAIETALGAAAGYLVVDRAEDGRDAIEYLKRHDGGRATFLPLDTIRPFPLREQGLFGMRGFCGAADTLIQCDAVYQKIVSNLLGRTVVAENLDAALAIAKTFRHRFRIVTKDGQVLQAGGAMTGGSASRSSGVLARAAKLRALTARGKELDAQYQTAEDACHTARREWSAAEYDGKAIEAEGARVREERARAAAVAEQHTVLLESLRQRAVALQLERDNLSAARVQYEEQLARSAQMLAAKGKERAAVGQRQEAARARLRELETAGRENTAALARLTAEQAQNRAEQASEQRALADLERLLHDMAETLRTAEDGIDRFRAEIVSMQAELSQMDAHEEADRTAAEALRREIAGAVSRRMELERQKNEAEKAAQHQNDEILTLERELARLDHRYTQRKTEEKQILDKMWENYELTPTPAAQIAQSVEDPEQSRKRVVSLRAEMRALGNVNLDAVGEYETLMERYRFLSAQKEDLEKAQGELRQIIGRLTVRMKEIFASGFAQLNAYFGDTFREMFGGGHAELVLEDTSDILSCGIEIRVSPPGKALKTLTLLSGGEKAFVAIALYFAILKLRPTPFCVLDEIEAALDDVNVLRFAKYIRRLTDHTQFIVITHRRGTMEEADMLYGVTMQERGVSKLLMLNLAEAERRLGLQKTAEK